MSELSKNLLRKKHFLPLIVEGERPRFRDVWPEWISTVNVFKHREAFTTWIWLSHHLLCISFAGLFAFNYLSIGGALLVLAFALLHAHFFHTFWYHRFASHKAFKFRKTWFAKAIYWLNPLMIKEETYVIPHFVHHKLSDKPGDPYGPRNGYWGSFSATESANFFNRDMGDKEYRFASKFLTHIPSSWNNEEQFRKTGSFEKEWRYPVRFLICNGFWCSFFLLLGSPLLLTSFYTGALVFLLIMRDFNYRGHDEESEHEPKLDSHSLAINQLFYGFVASEWHDNHHRFSSSARSGFQKHELDISFLITRLLCNLGILDSFIDSSKGFEREIVRVREQQLRQASSTKLTKAD